MKLYNYLLFVLLSATTSLHAMEKVELMHYNPESHHNAVTAIFKEAFPRANMDEVISAPWLNPSNNLIVAEYDSKPCGFVVYSHNSNYTSKAFSDVWWSPDQDEDTLLKICTIDRLAVSAAHKKQGIGSFLMRYTEEQARTQGNHFMSLVSINNSKPFYEKQGFRKTMPNLIINCMAKPLDKPGQDKMSRLLSNVIALRTQNQCEDFLPTQNTI